MPSGWDVYYVVFLSAFLGLGIPSALASISFLISPKVTARKKRGALDSNTVLTDATQVNLSVLGNKVNARFFLATNAALLLITLVLVLVPCVGLLQPGGDHEELLRGWVAIITIAGFAGLGLLYSARKADLSWLKTHRDDSSD